MKRQKYKYQKKGKHSINELKKETLKTDESFFEKYFARYNVLFVISLIIFIGILAFREYITGEYLFFFKDIGSDSLNQDYPAILHKVRLLKSEYFSIWSFFSGMGRSLNNIIPVDPYTGFRFLEKQIGVATFDSDYFIFGSFHRKFVFNFLLIGIIFHYYLKTISIKKFSALIGSLLISFSGFIVLGSSWGFSGQVFKAVFVLLYF